MNNRQNETNFFGKWKTITVSSIYNSRLPILKPESVAKRIIEAVQIEQQFLCIPRDIYWVSVVKA